MGFAINRVTTGVGDRGTTRLAGGQEVSKADLRIEAYGTLDELNAVLGVLVESLRLASEPNEKLLTELGRIQNELFDLGGELAVLPEDRHEKQALIVAEDIQRLEEELEATNQSLPTLRSFILPGGGLAGAYFHQARTVCRRAERRLVSLHEVDAQRPEAIKYLNRLSDWLFVMGRAVARESGRGEVLWQPGQR